jgi:TolB-like protein/DNA-binding winged helix-turn-helix (wHTH) protein/Tfp pilus assembly protein PilF
MPLETQRFYSFEEFRVDAAKRLLFYGERRIPVAPKVFDTLLVLVENSGRVVEKDELMRLVWPDTVVEENNLNQTISALRKALGEDPTQHRYIVTVPGRGYRFVGPVNGSPVSAGAVSERQAAQADRPTSTQRKPKRRSLVLLTLAVLILAAASVTYLVIRRHREATDTSVAAIKSLAVLPLDNLSHDPAEDYFADGMTDELITELGQIATLRVISRTSVMQYRGTHKSLSQIARELNVDAVVEGTILRSGDRVRITAQLIRAPMDKHLWAHSYEGDLREVLALQENVAKDIAGQIRAQLTPQELAKLKNARSVNPAAYEAYLRGNYFADKRTAEALTKAIEYFEEAIRDDPNWAPAYAGLADVYVVLSEYKSVPTHESHAIARVAARRAVELDDSLAEAHTELANLAGTEDYDWPGAEREFRRAIELNPGNATAHYFHAMNLMSMGHWEEASAEMGRARELDPLSIIINANIGLVYYYARHPDRAIEAERKALELEPNTAFIYEYMGLAYLQKGKYQEAIGHLQKAVGLSNGFPWYQAELAYSYSAAGSHAQAGRILTNLKSRSRRQYVSSYSLAVAYIGLGERDAALARLQKAYEDREDQVALLKIEPLFDTLHADPRFQDLLRRIGLYTGMQKDGETRSAPPDSLQFQQMRPE